MEFLLSMSLSSILFKKKSVMMILTFFRKYSRKQTEKKLLYQNHRYEKEKFTFKLYATFKSALM